jgi:hypothetical protein
MSAAVASSLESSVRTVWDVTDEDHSSALFPAVRHLRFLCSLVGSALSMRGRVSFSADLGLLLEVAVARCPWLLWVFFVCVWVSCRVVAGRKSVSMVLRVEWKWK